MVFGIQRLRHVPLVELRYVSLTKCTGQHIWGLNEKPKTSNCDQAWNDYTKWTPETQAQLLSLAKSHMDALGDFFFWTW